MVVGVTLLLGLLTVMFVAKRRAHVTWCVCGGALVAMYLDDFVYTHYEYILANCDDIYVSGLWCDVILVVENSL